MTVIAGFVGSDGAVVASDSEATESGHTRYDVEKIWTCGGLVMGYTGTTSVKQPLAAALDKAVSDKFKDATEIDRWTARALLRQKANAPLKDCYDHHLGARDQHGVPMALMGALLVIGRDSAGYWMLELDHMVQATFYTDAGFHTVGSGAPAAYVSHSLMSEYDSAGRAVAQLKLIAHRTVQTCIDSIGGPLGVGGHVQLWSSKDGKPFAKATQKDAEVTAMGVEQWRGIERESLNEVVLGGAFKSDELSLPEPPGDGTEAVHDEAAPSGIPEPPAAS